ncbi:MAG: hypothetical protein MJ101_07590, partial [Clostridia bacterium]|nr:hypothetical protein [Clostridia bacterium]
MKKKNDRLTARTPDGYSSSAYLLDDIASANEYTGMTPTLPLTDAEAESYVQLSYEISAAYKKLFDCHEKLPELPSTEVFPALNRLR